MFHQLKIIKMCGWSHYIGVFLSNKQLTFLYDSRIIQGGVHHRGFYEAGIWKDAL